MKTLGAFILLFAAFLYERGYADKRKREAADTAALLRLFRYMKSELVAFRKPPPSILASFSDAVLEENGFLPAVRSGKLPEEAIASLILTDHGKSIYDRLFSALGREYRDSAVSALEAAAEALQRESEDLQAGLSKKLKISRTLLLSGGLSFLLLIV